MKKKVNGNDDEGMYGMDTETGDENQLQEL